MFSIDLSDWYFNINSTQQMQEFLYEFLGLKPLKEANTKGNISVDEATITYYAEKENVKFCSLLIAYRKLLKARNTYLADIFRNISCEDFYLHPEFWLNVAETYRSSSSSPNFQNIPKHGQLIAGIMWKVIRKIITSIPDPNWLLGEVDYDGAEVKVSGMLSDDPQLIEDLNNDFDMHSHWAIKLFGLKGMSFKEVKTKYDETYRFLAKNNFTFADLFGAIAESIAEEMRKSDFYKEYVNKKWLQVNRKGSFENYYINFSIDQVRSCQEARKQRYPVHAGWQDSLVKLYYQTGYVDNPFGFRRRYPLKRNEIINHPIQSTSFLLLLDSLNRIEDECEKDDYFKSHFIGQIHDSGLPNLYRPEIPEFIEFVNDKMTNKPYLPWTKKVKMKVDWSFGHNWLDMFKVKNYKQLTYPIIKYSL